MDVMKSIVYCKSCNKKTTHYKKDAGAWFYQVCEQCDKETLLQGETWEKFNINRIDDIKERSGLYQEGN